MLENEYVLSLSKAACIKTRSALILVIVFYYKANCVSCVVDNLRFIEL